MDFKIKELQILNEKQKFGQTEQDLLVKVIKNNRKLNLLLERHISSNPDSIIIVFNNAIDSNTKEQVDIPYNEIQMVKKYILGS